MHPQIYILIVNFIATPINILLHELGHASAALMLSSEPVHIDLALQPQSKIFDIKFGRLRISFSWRNLFFHSGLTHYSGVTSIWFHRIIILSGILVNALVLILTLKFGARYANSRLSACILFGIALNCVILIISNLWPRVARIGKESYETDGLLLLNSFKRNQNPWHNIVSLYDRKRFADCINLLCSVTIDDSLETPKLRFAVFCCTRQVGYPQLGRFAVALAQRAQETDDILALFFAYAHLNDFDKAAFYLAAWKERDPENPNHSSNAGFLAMIQGDFANAKSLFETALESRQTAYIYANLGYICSKLGENASSESYLQRAKEIDENEPYLHRAIAQISLENSNIDVARRAYAKALAIRENIYPIYGL